MTKNASMKKTTSPAVGLRGPTHPEFLKNEVLADIFRDSVKRAPKSLAIVAGSRKLTYADLDEQSDQIAAELLKRGAKPGVVLGLYFTRGLNLLLTQLAVTKTGATWLRLEIPYPKTGGPGGNFHIVGMCTPISPTKTAIVFWRCRKVSGWQRDTWRFLYKNRLEARHWHVLEQDRLMIEEFEPDANHREMLYQHDIGLVKARKLMRAKAEAQLKALAEAGPGRAA